MQHHQFRNVKNLNRVSEAAQLLKFLFTKTKDSLLKPFKSLFNSLCSMVTFQENPDVIVSAGVYSRLVGHIGYFTTRYIFWYNTVTLKWVSVAYLVDQSCILLWMRNICITFVQCRTNVEDVGPTLYKFLLYKCFVFAGIYLLTINMI